MKRWLRQAGALLIVTLIVFSFAVIIESVSAGDDEIASQPKSFLSGINFGVFGISAWLKTASVSSPKSFTKNIYVVHNTQQPKVNSLSADSGYVRRKSAREIDEVIRDKKGVVLTLGPHILKRGWRCIVGNDCGNQMYSGNPPWRSTVISNFDGYKTASVLFLKFKPRAVMRHFDVGALHFFSRIISAPQLAGLESQGHKLKKGKEGQQSRKAHDPIGRRFFICLIGILAAFALCVQGGEYFYNERRALGASLFSFGTVLAVSSFGLWFLSGFRWTWGWFL